ncbi:MAG: hypothetical protein K940chlam7_00367 [Chlamydiae bacterium]|nr:hypothetical protein [Chlamydiota bacterium]
MENISENNLIRFTKITKKKDGLFANFKAKGIRGGTVFTATISVDLAATEVDPGDSLEKIIEECALIAERDIKKSNLQFEGIESV